MYIKIILAVIFIVTGFLQANGGELDRSQRPAPAPAPSIELGEYHSFELENGLRVFVVENHQLPRVTFNLVIDRDPIMEGDKKGFTSVTGSLIESRTQNRSREELNEEIDFLGARVSASSTGLFASSLSHNKESLLEIISDMILNPDFTQEEMDRIINRRKSSLAAERDAGTEIASKIRRALFFEGHPYAEITSEETISNVTLEDCQNYFDTYFRPNIAYMAVVGDVDADEIRELLEEHLGSWETAEVPTHEYNIPNRPEQRQVAINDRAHATQTVLNIGHPVELMPGSEDEIPARVANTLLGGGFFRLNENLRETHAYTYGSYSQLNSDREIGHFMTSADVGTDVTDSSVYQILYEMDRLRTESVPEEELSRVLNYITGNFAISLEDPQTIARFALNIARYDLPEDYYQNYLKKVESVTSEDIREVALKYIHPDQSYIVAVGAAEKYAEKLRAFSDVEPRYFDREGNEIAPPREIDIPEGLTAQDMINNYIEARGGRANLELIQTLSTTTSTVVQGMEISVEEHILRPDKYMHQMKMGENVLSKTVINGDKGYAMEGGGTTRALTDDDLKESRAEGQVVEELGYDEFGVEAELTGIREVEGKEAYVLTVTLPGGTEKSVYYDVESGLKVQETTLMETPQGDMPVQVRYLEYKEIEGLRKSGFFNRLFSRTVSGVVFPVKMEQSMGPQSFELTVDDRKVNHDLDPDLFKVEN